MHGRLAIENGDIGEYNQCQTQLTVLYASGIQGNRAEFIAYAILYFSMKDNQEGLGFVVVGLNLLLLAVSYVILIINFLPHHS